MTSEKQLSSNQILLPGEIIGDSYEVIKSKIVRAKNQEQLITSYLVRDRQSKDNSLFVLELIDGERNGKKYICDRGFDDPNFASKSISEEFFIQQFGFIKKLSSHVQIPKLRTYFKADSGYYIVYEYVRGELLASILNNRRLNESEVVSLLQDAARIYDLAIKSNLIDFNLLPYNILKTHANQRYVLGNLKGLFFTQQTTAPLTTEKQKYLFQSQLHSLAEMLIQCLVKEEPKVIPANWYKQINLSPRLQNILAKMIAVRDRDLYNSFQEIIDDCQPLLKIDLIIGERYRLMRYLGEKNGIKTYLARNIREKKPNSSLLIVKQSTLANSSPELAQIKLNRLQQEVTKLQQLSLVAGIDAVREQSEEELYYIRSYVEGISLTKRLNQQQLLTPEKVIRLLIKILSKLKLIHQQGLIHRNLKPSNIIVTKDDRDVVLVDLGILQAIDEKSESYDKYPSLRKPPEQIVGRPTPSSDLYALGIIAIEMLTGLSIREIARDSFEERQIWQDKISDYRALIAIIEKMICTEVEQRYQSAEEVLQDLKQFSYLQGEGKVLQPSWKNRLLFFSNRNKKPLIAIAITVILVGGLESLFPFIRPRYYLYRGSQKLTNQPTAALNSFERALQLQPQLARAWIGKGNAFLSLDFPTPALEAYEKATTFHPDSAAAWAGKGDVFFTLGELERAISNYNKALELKPEDTNTETKQGRTLSLLSRYEEAFSIQEQALAQNSASNIELLSDAGRSALALGKNNRALSILSRVETTAPLRPYLWQDKVTALRNLNRDTEAIENANLVRTNYSIALEKEPQKLELWLGKGAFLKQLQLYEKALEAYERAILIAPDSDVAWLGIAEVLLALQEDTKASEAVEKTLEIKPNSFRAWYTRGLILQERQDWKQALGAFERSIEINPDFFPAWRARAAIFIAQNNYSEGIKSLQKAIALAPQDIKSWLDLSDAYQNIQQTESALNALDKAIVLQPRNSDYWLRKGFLWEQQQEYTKACDVYRQAIKIAPSLQITATMERVGCRFD